MAQQFTSKVTYFILVCLPVHCVFADTTPEFEFQTGWDSAYISEGRDNLEQGGIAWSTFSATLDDISAFVIFGRADQTHYIEWNAGLEYGYDLNESFNAIIGFQRIEAFGDERESDNEFYGSIHYTDIKWLVSSVQYTYSTETSGHFIDLVLRHPWQTTQALTLTPFVIQSVDFGYASEQYNGPNHLHLGVEAKYVVSSEFSVLAHVSHTVGGSDVKQQIHRDGSGASTNHNYAGVHLSWIF